MKKIRLLAFWSFQLINMITSCFMTFSPGQLHESLFQSPASAYAQLGFSPSAVSMLHQVIRGQGAALLAVSIFVFCIGFKSRHAYLLMFLVCLLSLGAHLATLIHHLQHAEVLRLVGSWAGLYGIIGINAVVGGFNLATFIFWKRTQSGGIIGLL